MHFNTFLPLENKQNQWLQHLYMQAPFAIGLYLGSDHVIELANPRMLEIWDKTSEEVINKPLFEALPEVSGQGFEEILKNVLLTGEPFSGDELPATLKRNGIIELAYFNILYEPLKEEDGSIKGILQIAMEVTDQVEARKKVELNEKYLRFALEGGKMGTWHNDLVYGKITHSLEHDKVFGYSEPIEWNYDVFLNHLHPDDRKMADDYWNFALISGELNFEARIIWPDHSLHWIHIRAKTAFDENGKPISITGIVSDITERKLAEEREKEQATAAAAKIATEKQEKMFSNLFMQAPALICILKGEKHVFDLVNPLYQQLFPNRILEGSGILDALPELKGQEIIATLDNVYKTGETFIGKEVPILLDRNNKGVLEEGYFNFVYQAMRDTEGTIIGILVFAFEITEQIFSRKKIEKSENSLRLALEAGKMGTWDIDLKSKTGSRSQEYMKIFGYDNEVQGWGTELFLQHTFPEYHDTVLQKLKESEESGKLKFVARIIRKDGENRWIAVNGQTFFENGEAVRMAGVITDITEAKVADQKLHELTLELAERNSELIAANQQVLTRNNELGLANEELKRINSDMDNFIYTASHDLKAPISNIEGLVRVLIRNLSPDTSEKEMVKKLIEMIKASIDRFKKTIKELTEIAKIQKSNEEIIPLSFSEVIREVQMDMQMVIDESETIIDVDVSKTPSLPFSPKNLKSIIYNLISNAIKYRSPNRQLKINIDSSENEKYTVLSVADNGLGMKQSDLTKIFTMFKRLHTHVEGSGIGLYIVKKILDNTGGKIEVESKEGLGSTFKIFFKKP